MEILPIKKRFRGFLPVVVDIETSGFNAKTNAILEISAVTLYMDHDKKLHLKDTHMFHVEPFKSAELDVKSLEFNKIDPHHPFRFALPETEVFNTLFKLIRDEIKLNECTRAVMVAHNPAFDLSFMQAALKRCEIIKDPFHPFTTFDTATLGGIAFGQTVLARACESAGIPFDTKEAHSAKYDAEKTAELFCRIVNQWPFQL